MNGLQEESNTYNLQLLCSNDAVECHFDVKLARYFVIGSFASRKRRQNISSLAVLPF